MIRRQIADRHLLIQQVDHARFSGFLARHLGNARFARPDPVDDVLAAVEMHDSGWPLHDLQPTLNKLGLPLDVFETPLEVALAAWQESVEQAGRHSSYAQLLVSLHVLDLSSIASGNPHTRREVFELNKFQQRQIEIQVNLRNQLGLRTDLPLRMGLSLDFANRVEQQLVRNFRILQAADRLSLAICCTKVPFESVSCHPSNWGDEPIEVRFRRSDDHTLRVSPWCFDEPELSYQLPVRDLPGRAWEAVDSFRATYRAAPIGHARLRLCQ